MISVTARTSLGTTVVEQRRTTCGLR